MMKLSCQNYPGLAPAIGGYIQDSSGRTVATLSRQLLLDDSDSPGGAGQLATYNTTITAVASDSFTCFLNITDGSSTVIIVQSPALSIKVVDTGEWASRSFYAMKRDCSL